jgi:hypothetical protein
MLRIDESDPLENDDKVIKVAMNVADGDYGLPLIRWGFGRPGPSHAYQYQEQEGGKTSAVAGRNTDRRSDHLLCLLITEPSRIYSVSQGIPYEMRILGLRAEQVNKLK